VHYPIDVMCGAILGLGIGYMFYKLMRLTENKLWR
jgi:membrane-associated phospholipid phosphatase